MVVAYWRRAVVRAVNALRYPMISTARSGRDLAVRRGVSRAVLAGGRVGLPGVGRVGLLCGLLLVCLVGMPHGGAWARGGDRPSFGVSTRYALPQDNGGRQQPIDTIILTSGRRLTGTIRAVTNLNVFYTPPGKKEERSFERRNVHMVIYANGRAERLNDMAFQSIEETDWRIIILTDDPEEVRGLYSQGVVSGESSKTNKSMRSAKRSAETRIKKRAVAKKGLIVLVTRRVQSGGYGEIPTYYIEGEAYGLEPPDVSEVDGGTPQ